MVVKLSSNLDDDQLWNVNYASTSKPKKYLRTKSDDTLPETTKRIHRSMAEENRERRERLKNVLGQWCLTLCTLLLARRSKSSHPRHQQPWILLLNI